MAFDIFASSQAFGEAVLSIVAIGLGLGVLGGVAYFVLKSVHGGLNKLTGKEED